MVASRSSSAGRVYLRFFEGYQNDHLHLDMALSSIFPRGGKPTVTTKAPEILHRLAAHKGQKLELLIIGRYIIDITEEKIQSGPLFANRLVSMTNKATLEVASASIVVRNDANISFLQWDIFDTVVIVDIYGECKTQVSDDYLVNAFGLVQAAFKTYILGEATK